MLGARGDAGGGDGGQRGSSIGCGKFAYWIKISCELIAIQRFWRNLVEIGVGQKLLDRRLINNAGRGECPALILRHALQAVHQIIDRRIRGAGVKGQQSPRHRRIGKGWIDPCQIAHPTKVQEGQGRIRPDPAGAGVVIERGQGRALPAHSHIAAAEIPHDRNPQNLGQKRTVSGLMRAPVAWIMRQRLTVKADQIGPRKPRQQFDMRQFHNLGRRGHAGIAGPEAKTGTDGGGLGLGIRAIGGRAEIKDRMAIGQDHRAIHPVQRSAGHGAKRPDRPRLTHLPLGPLHRYTPPILKHECAMTYHPKSDFMRVMMTRGFLADCTDYQALDEALVKGVVPGYIGFDATAKSLHVGSLIQIMMLRWLQKCGGKPIVLMGGGTTKVGDPSFRADERPLLTNAQIDDNIAGIKRAFAPYVTFGEGATDAIMVNNAEWLDDLNYLGFLRDIGRHFSVNRMLSFESVKSRLDREQSLSFLEFNYMILQAYDFLELNRRYGCLVQMGGSDQWGNIVNGVDLTRRVIDHEVYGLTSPLLTTSDGKKMGKSANGAVWLNADLLSPYEFWQFWRNTTDADVGRFLKLYTEMPLEECDRLGALAGSEINAAKIVLANAVTTLLHGAEAAAAAEATAREVFEKGGVGDDLPTVHLDPAELAEGLGIVQLFVRAGLAASGKDAKRLIQDGGAKVNDDVVTDASLRYGAGDLAEPLKLTAGKKRHALVTLG